MAVIRSKQNKDIENLKKNKNKNMAKVSNDLLEAFVRKNNSVGLKILLYIAKSQMPYENDKIALLPNRRIIDVDIQIKPLLDYCKFDIKTLKRNLKILTETSINIYDDDGEGYMTIIPHAKIGYDGILRIDIFSDIIKLTHALSKYSIIDVSELMKLESKHAIRMSLLLRRIDNYEAKIKKQKSFELDELNLLFGTRYASFSQFERRILIPVQSELLKMQKLIFEYTIQKDKKEPTRRGRANSVACIITLKENRQLSLF